METCGAAVFQCGGFVVYVSVVGMVAVRRQVVGDGSDGAFIDSADDSASMWCG